MIKTLRRASKIAKLLSVQQSALDNASSEKGSNKENNDECSVIGPVDSSVGRSQGCPMSAQGSDIDAEGESDDQM